MVPAAGGEHRIDVGGGGDDDGDALACTTALTATAGTRTGTGSGGCESRTLAPPRQSSPSIAPAKDLQPSRQSRTTCTTTTTTGASSPRLGSPELRASPTASPRGAGLLAEVDELSWRGAARAPRLLRGGGPCQHVPPPRLTVLTVRQRRDVRRALRWLRCNPLQRTPPFLSAK